MRMLILIKAYSMILESAIMVLIDFRFLCYFLPESIFTHVVLLLSFAYLHFPLLQPKLYRNRYNYLGTIDISSVSTVNARIISSWSCIRQSKHWYSPILYLHCPFSKFLNKWRRRSLRSWNNRILPCVLGFSQFCKFLIRGFGHLRVFIQFSEILIKSSSLFSTW